MWLKPLLMDVWEGFGLSLSHTSLNDQPPPMDLEVCSRGRAGAWVVLRRASSLCPKGRDHCAPPPGPLS